MGSVVIEYTNDEGSRSEIREEGDFEMGRYKTALGPKLTLVDAFGNFKYLCDCPNTVSRLRIGEEGSPCHARFFWRNNILYVQDMGSLNGTNVNDCVLPGWDKRQMSHPYPLKEDSMVKIGSVEVMIRPLIDRPAPVPNGFGIEGLNGLKVPPEVMNGGGPVQFKIVVKGDYIAGNSKKKHVKKNVRMDNVVNRGKVSLNDDKDDFDDDDEE